MCIMIEGWIFLEIKCNIWSPESNQPGAMKNRDIYWRRYKMQETLYTGQWHLSPLQSRHLGTSQVLPASLSLFKTLQNPLLESPSAAPSYVPETHWQSEISSLSKVILVLGKARSHRVWNLGLVTWVIWRLVWDMMCERACCCDEAANH